MCPLQILTLGSSSAAKSGYEVQILQLLPSLTKLHLTHHATDELLTRLACTPDSGILVPKLHTIELTIMEYKNPMCSRMADMIESRWKFSGICPQSAQHQITPLKHIRIYMSNISTFDSKAHKRLQRLRDEGLDISFMDKNRVANRI
jgi:hypothetical protein